MLTKYPVRPLSQRTLRRNEPSLWPALVVFGLGCLAYAAAAEMWFLKDDLAMSLLTDANGRPDPAQLVRNFLWPTSMTHDQFFRPLPVLFGWFDLNMFGPDPLAFRICNIGFHGLNGVLLAIFVNQLTRFRRPAAGWFAGAIFALHPLHGEAVLWVTQRMVVMCATFSLLTLIGLESWIRTRRPAALATCVVSALAAALCKEVTVALPASMVLIALTAPAADQRARIRRTLIVLALGAALSAAMLITRKVIFGVWVGTYGNLSAAEYAKSLRIFERMPESLANGLLGVNAIETPPKVRMAFAVAGIAFAVYAIIRLVPALRDRRVARAAVVLAAFAVASFVPTMGIFYIEPSLMNGRFLYQPLLGVVGVLLLGFTFESRVRPFALAAPAALAVVFALAGQLNLRAFAGADTQIRAVRDGIIRETGLFEGDVAAIVYRVPTDYHGVVTLDRSLELAMKPPFQPPPGVDVFPFVAGLERSWPDRIPELRAWLEARPGRRVVHLVCAEDPSRVSPLIGVLDAAAGLAAPEILAPADGALLVHPSEPPAFVFQPVRGAASYRLRLASGALRIEIDLDPQKNLKRVGTRREYRFALGSTATRVWTGDGPVTELPDPAAVWSEPSIETPAAIAWSLEALDENGDLLGRSATRALILVTSK